MNGIKQTLGLMMLVPLLHVAPIGAQAQFEFRPADLPQPQAYPPPPGPFVATAPERIAPSSLPAPMAPRAAPLIGPQFAGGAPFPRDWFRPDDRLPPPPPGSLPVYPNTVEMQPQMTAPLGAGSNKAPAP